MNIFILIALIVAVVFVLFFMLLVLGLSVQASKHKKDIRELQGIIVRHDRHIDNIKKDVQVLNDKTRGASSVVLLSGNPHYQ